MPITAATMPKPGIASAILLIACAGSFAVVVMRFDLLVHQRFELVLVHVAADDQAQVVLDELEHVMVVEDRGRFLNTSLFAGSSMTRSSAHHAFLARQRQQLVHHCEQVEVVLLLIARAFQQHGEAGRNALGHAERVGNDQRAVAAPPMISSSDGCHKAPSCPPCTAKPPRTQPNTTRMPMMRFIALES